MGRQAANGVVVGEGELTCGGGPQINVFKWTRATEAVVVAKRLPVLEPVSRDTNKLYGDEKTQSIAVNRCPSVENSG
jgi:hypothetical protein